MPTTTPAARAKATTIRLDSRILKRLDRLARARNRSRQSVINRYLDYERWFVREVSKGLDEADRGELIDHEEVVTEWETLLSSGART